MTKQEEARREMERCELRMALRNHCIRERYCTGADSIQYELMLKMFSEDMEKGNNIERNFDRLATMIWICSKTDKSIDDIDSELNDLYLNTLHA